MFDLMAKRMAWLPVKWKGFADTNDGPGVVVEHEIEVHVELVERDMFAELFVEPDAAKDPEKAEKFKAWNDLGRFTRIADGWRKVVANGQPVPFTADNVERMMQVANFPLAFFQAYADAWQGIGETRRGNSDDLPAPGPVASESQ